MKRLLYSMIFIVCAFMQASCEKEEQNLPDVDFKSYIIGNWHSYKATVYGNGQEKTVEITPTNEFSSMYIELNFDSNNKVTSSAWQGNPDGTTKWISETDNYTVNGNTVEIIESSSNNNSSNNNSSVLNYNTSYGTTTRAGINDEIITLMFLPQNRDLMLKFNFTVNGIAATGNVYFKK